MAQPTVSFSVGLALSRVLSLLLTKYFLAPSLILFLFNAVWTTLFSTTYMLWVADGASHILANIASSVIWLLITTVLWVCHSIFSRSWEIVVTFISTGYCCWSYAQYEIGRKLFRTNDNITVCGDTNFETISSSLILVPKRCRQSLTVEALGWTEFGLCVLTMAATCLWVQSNKRHHVSATNLQLLSHA